MENVLQKCNTFFNIDMFSIQDNYIKSNNYFA